jgi:hypothetical protein
MSKKRSNREPHSDEIQQLGGAVTRSITRLPTFWSGQTMREIRDTVRPQPEQEAVEAYLGNLKQFALGRLRYTPNEFWCTTLSDLKDNVAAHERERREEELRKSERARAELAAAPKAETRRERRNATPEQDRINVALAEIYPGGVPDQASKPDKVLQAELVRKGVTARDGISPPTISSIRRATGRRRDRRR